MNRKTAARVIPGLLVVTLILAGCCNENWKGTGTVSGTLTINGVWDFGDIDAITVQSVDKCDNKYVHFSAREGPELRAVRDSLLANGSFTWDLEEQDVIATKVTVRFMVRPTGDFRSLFETRWSTDFKLDKNGEKIVNIVYNWPESGSH